MDPAEVVGAFEFAGEIEGGHGACLTLIFFTPNERNAMTHGKPAVGRILSAVNHHQKQHRLLLAIIDDRVRHIRSVSCGIPLAKGFTGIS